MAASSLAISGFIAAALSTYPAFTDRDAVVEAVIDRGLIFELIIRCPKQAGILTYSRVEQRYCTPDFTCFPDIRSAVESLCYG